MNAATDPTHAAGPGQSADRTGHLAPAGLRLTDQLRPAGDQGAAIAQIVDAFDHGQRDVCLLGATGTGKTFTTAAALARLDRPALVIAPNKTLAAQLAGELRELLPTAAVEYFVSYYDYYQPEAYLAASDTFIDKESTVNDEIDRLRHRTTAALLSRRDVVVVASVSCIYGLGDVDEYRAHLLTVKVGDTLGPHQLARQLVQLGYQRNDTAPQRGQFRLRGDVVEVHSVGDELLWRASFDGDRVEQITRRDPLLGHRLESGDTLAVYAASHYVSSESRLKQATASIEAELEQRLTQLRAEGRQLEAQRLAQRCRYDLELLETTGTCPGVENYSRHFDQRQPGQAPGTLLEFFDDDFICIVDESHLTVGQLGAMHAGDASRKHNLIEHGFRLPSAADNRPLTFDEFRQRTGQTLWLSATPGAWEQQHCTSVVEQLLRPTGICDPSIDIRPSDGQIDDLLGEIHQRRQRGQRTLVACLTKRMAEDLSDYLVDNGVKAEYLHSDIDTVERIEVLRRLREGTLDVLVGINLLREGLDLPEVSLVAVLDADKEGFLRSRSALIQTFGRAARHPDGHVICYADTMTAALVAAVAESDRRRSIQQRHNTDNGITPAATIGRDLPQLGGGGASGTVRSRRRDGTAHSTRDRHSAALKAEAAVTPDEADELDEGALEARMLQAAQDLRFEEAAQLRDLLVERRRLQP